MQRRLTQHDLVASSVEPAARRPAAPVRKASRGWMFGLLGFMFGAVFWHFVGFWDFVGRVVLKGPGESLAGDADAAKRSGRASTRVAGEIMELTTIAVDSCVTLRLDRDNGRVQSSDCPPLTMPLRLSRAGHREDATLMPVRRASAGVSWSTTIEADSTED